MKRPFAFISGLVLLIGLAAPSAGDEFSNRAVAYGFNPAFNLTVIYVKVPGKADDCVVSGFAPGNGSFNQSVPCNTVDVKFAAGTATVDANVVTSLGTTIRVNVSWTGSPGMQNKSVGFVNPSRTLGIGSKVATVSGMIGSFTITNAKAELSQRDIVP